MSKTVDLIIEDGDLASWRPINNTFAVKKKAGWKRTRDHWNGLLIQFGNYREFKAGQYMKLKKYKSKRRRVLFASVQFKGAGGNIHETRFLSPSSWISIHTDLEDRPEPVDLKDARLRMNLTKSRSKAPSLKRASFSPFASITFWHDWGGYEISAREHYIGGRLTLKYTFTFHDVTRVDVVEGKQPEEIKVADISTIVVNAVREARGVRHQTNDPPPQEP